MTSEFKLSHYFLLIKVKWRHVLNTQIIQKTISKHYPPCQYREAYSVEDISLQTVFILIKMFEIKFELQYEWTLPKIFSCGYRVLQLIYHNVEEVCDIKCSQK